MEEVIAAGVERVELSEEILRKAVQTLQAEGRVVVEGEAVYLRGLYQAERGIADSLKALMSQPVDRRRFEPDKATSWAQERFQIQFSEAQVESVKMAVSEKVSVITGGPGTGKCPY